MLLSFYFFFDKIPVIRLVRACNALKNTLFVAEFVGLVAAALEDEQVGEVAEETKAGYEEHELAVDLLRVDEALCGLDQKPYKKSPNN